MRANSMRAEQRATETTPALIVGASPAYKCMRVQMHGAEVEGGSLAVPSVAGYRSYSPSAGFGRRVRPV
jgi:hypothetical protein